MCPEQTEFLGSVLKAHAAAKAVPGLVQNFKRGPGVVALDHVRHDHEGNRETPGKNVGDPGHVYPVRWTVPLHFQQQLQQQAQQIQ